METQSSNFLEILSAVLFGLALIHTFSTKFFLHLAHRAPSNSVRRSVFHLLGEVELVFAVWAVVLVATVALLQGGSNAVSFVESTNFTEAAFVFAIMTIAATKPILQAAEWFIKLCSAAVPLPRQQAFLFSALVCGPLLGSAITEPAAMTVTALLLRDRFFSLPVSARAKYLTLAVLFVNVSIGGVLTAYAAPPVLMVARVWNWDSGFMLNHFGWKAVVAVFINAALLLVATKSEWKKVASVSPSTQERKLTLPLWLIIAHLLFLGVVVITNHHPTFFLAVFLVFLGFNIATATLQERVNLKDGLLVGCFLGGLILLGSMQRWWLAPLMDGRASLELFLGAAAFTAITDNAALTYLGTLIPSFTDEMKYALVAGAVAGGGLTVIANAPNPAGYALLRDSFGAEGIAPLRLLLAALVPTLIAMACFWGLPSL